MTLILISAQVFFAKRTIARSDEWEKAKVTIQNIETFKEKLKTIRLQGSQLYRADKGMPDLTTDEGREFADTTLGRFYRSLFSGEQEMMEDLVKSLDILDLFAYPIIMGYANEIGSYQSVAMDYYLLGNFIMPYAFIDFRNIGHHAKLLYRLWRIRIEQMFIKNIIEQDRFGRVDTHHMLSFEGTEVTAATLKAYDKKLGSELKKMQKEIEEFRKNSSR